MRKLIVLVLLALPMAASADYLDVYDVKLKEGCNYSKSMQVFKDFNTQWGAKYGYRIEIALPTYGSDLESWLWVGRIKSATDWGKAWDAWIAETEDPNSVAGKLNERFNECMNFTARRGYNVF